MNNKFQLPKGIIRVDNPDHPFTYDGPDILLSDKTGLIAIFRLRDNEQSSPSKMLSRLSNSLIAYPAETQMVLLWDNFNQHDISLKFDKFYFHRMIELKDLRLSKSMLREKKTSSTVKTIKDLQRRIFNSQAQIQMNNLNYIKKTDFGKVDFKNFKELKRVRYLDRLMQKEIYTRANIYEYEDFIIGSKKLSKSTSDIVELRPYFEFALSTDISIDNGVPYFNQVKEKTLNLNNVPIIKFDPIKPIRIASLFGWYISSSNNVFDLINRLPKKHLRK